MLSKLDERNVYDLNYYVVESYNEIVVLENSELERKECIDLISAYGATNFGHNNKEINTNLSNLKSDICASFYPKEANDFSEWIVNKLELENFEVLFQVGGSFAVSTAISIAQHNRQGKVVHLQGSFHGLGLDSLSITEAQKNMSLQKNQFLEDIQDHFISLRVDSDDYMYIDWKEVSSFIFEPIQGANGYVPIDYEWIKKVIKHVKSFGVTVIADEIQCGYFRHGEFCVSKKYGYNPDIYLFSKSLTNGLYPYSLVVYNQNLKERLPNKIYLSHTFQTSAVGCYIMMGVANYIDNHPIEEYCNRIYEVMLPYKKKLEKFDFISNINILKTTLSFTVEIFSTKEIVKFCFQKNVLLFSGGVNGDRIRIAPPLTTSPSILQEALNVVLNCIEELSKGQIK